MRGIQNTRGESLATYILIFIGNTLINILAYSGDCIIPKECKNEIETLLLDYVLKAINRGNVVINFENNPYIESGVKEIIAKQN